MDIFSDSGSAPIFLMTDAPPRSCNYRCPYCFWNKRTQNGSGFLPDRDEFARWSTALRTAVEKIKPQLMVSMGPRGEALIIPKWWPLFKWVASRENVTSVSFLSNLSRRIEPYFEGVEMRKVGITATLHPTQFKDHDRDLAAFIDQVKWLKNSGARVVVNYVLTPDQIGAFPAYKKYFSDIGVTMTANLFRGLWGGAIYPEAFSAAELETIREHLSDVPFIYEYQSHLMHPRGNPCTAGRFLIFMESDGQIFNCNFAHEHMGSVFDDRLEVYTENRPCTASKCECKWTIPLQESFVRNYVGVGNIHEFKKRKAGEIGEHPFV